MKNDTYDICIVGGLGHVGMPLGILFAKNGKKVVLYDIDQEKIDYVSKGKMPFLEPGTEKSLKETLNESLFISSDKEVIAKSHFIILTIGTPVTSHLNPNFTLFKKLFTELMPLLNDNQHIIIRSTVYPGTTEKAKNMLAKHGKSSMISFCPERIAEGKAMEELHVLPQIVASFDDDSYKDANDLFLTITNKTVPLTPIEAELGKLYTNVWRYLQFAISNQFYQIATQNELDFYKIYNAITFNYPRISNFAKAGFAAGPCLFKDTMQLATYGDNNFFLGHAAMLINEGLPSFIIQRLKQKVSIKTKTIGILGMAFKADSDDPRESLSYKLKNALEIEAKKVLCSDPLIKDDRFVTADELIGEADIIILGAPHSAYKDLKIDKTSKILVDIWNFFGEGGLF